MSKKAQCRVVTLMKDMASQFKGLSDDAEVWRLIRPQRSSLVKLKRLSVRNRAWLSALDWKQRRLMDIVIRIVDKIRSVLLLRVLAPLVKRLLIASFGDISKGVIALMDKGAYEIMRHWAIKTASIAQKWGNKSAYEWLDEGFIRYFMVMNLPQNGNSVALVC